VSLTNARRTPGAWTFWIASLPIVILLSWVTGLGELGWLLWGLAGFLQRPVHSVPARASVPAALFAASYLISGFRMDEDRILQYGYRGLGYIAVAGAFVGVLGRPPSQDLRRVLLALLAVCGTLGVLAIAGFNPSWAGPLGSYLPQDRSQMLVDWSVVELAQEQAILRGADAVRPNAPFPYSNLWGAVVALLILYVIASKENRSFRLRGNVDLALVCLALVPFVVSYNRAAWASLVLGVLGILALGRRGSRRLAACTVVGVLLGIAYFGVWPALEERLRSGHSDEGRSELTRLAFEAWTEAPLLGHGAPIPNPGNERPAIGTHGQWTLIAVSQGVLGILASVLVLVGGLMALASSTARRRRLVVYAVGAIGTIQAIFYELLPGGLVVLVLTAAALASTERLARLPGGRTGPTPQGPGIRERRAHLIRHPTRSGA